PLAKIPLREAAACERDIDASVCHCVALHALNLVENSQWVGVELCPICAIIYGAPNSINRTYAAGDVDRWIGLSWRCRAESERRYPGHVRYAAKCWRRAVSIGRSLERIARIGIIRGQEQMPGCISDPIVGYRLHHHPDIKCGVGDNKAGSLFRPRRPAVGR